MSGADDADTRASVVPMLMLVLLSLLVLLSWLLTPKGRPVVVVYGDSLTVQSESAARSLHHADREHVVFRAAGGTAMCDWVARAAVDSVALHPQRVVLAFTGNTASCAAAAFRTGGVAGATALYEMSLREMRAIFRHVPVTIVIPPAMQNLPHGWYPFNGNPALVAMYKRVELSCTCASIPAPTTGSRRGTSSPRPGPRIRTVRRCWSGCPTAFI